MNLSIKKRLSVGALQILSAAVLFSVGTVNAQIINTTTSFDGLGSTLDGNGGGGYFVKSASLTLSNVTLLNYVAQGGDGSGGGAGLGGAVFINGGASLTLNNVSFGGNGAVGGMGGTGAIGGSVNGLFNSGSVGGADPQAMMLRRAAPM